MASVEGGYDWRIDIPGRMVFKQFAALAGIQVGRLKQLYLPLAKGAGVFGDIIRIFERFRVLQS
jgi:hypothetical protein